MSEKSVFVCDVCGTEELDFPCNGYEIGVVGLPLVKHCCIGCKPGACKILRAFGINFETREPKSPQASRGMEWGKIVILGIKGV